MAIYRNERGTTVAYKKSEIMRQRILDAANQLFYENGYQNTAMRQIAKACEIQQSLLYYYYPNKGELAREILKDFSEQVDEVMTSYLTYDQFPLLYIFSFCRLLVKELSKDPKELRFYCEIFDTPNPKRRHMYRIHEAVVRYRPGEITTEEKAQQAIIMSDSVWSGLINAQNLGLIQMDIDEILDATDLTRFTYLGLTEDAVRNFCSMARGIVSTIPIQGIELFQNIVTTPPEEV